MKDLLQKREKAYEDLINEASKPYDVARQVQLQNSSEQVTNELNKVITYYNYLQSKGSFSGLLGGLFGS